MKQLFPIIALLLSYCSQPAEFKRDGETDPLSPSFTPATPYAVKHTFTAEKLVRLTWGLDDEAFDSLIIERKTTLDTSFVQIANLPTHARDFIDTIGLKTYPMSYRISSVFRCDGNEYKSSSDVLPIEFGTISKPTLTYNTTTQAIEATFSNTFKIPFIVDYYVKRLGQESYEKMATRPGPASTASTTHTISIEHADLYLDMAVVYSFEANNHRSVVDSIPYSLPVHIARNLNVTPLTEALGRIVWTNPYDFHDDIIVQVNDREWILPDTTTTFDLVRFFHSDVTYNISVRYRKGGNVGEPATITRKMSIAAAGLSYQGPTIPYPILRVTSSTSANSIFHLGEYYVLEKRKDNGPYLPFDSVKVTSTTHDFIVTGLDTTSTYRFHVRSLTSKYSPNLGIRHKLSWGSRSWSGVPNETSIRHFSPYDDLYVVDDQPSTASVYDFDTGQKLYELPALGTGRPNGFTKDGGFVLRMGVANGQTTLRHFTSNGSHSGDVVIPGTSYIIGYFDDVIYYNPNRRMIERLHMPTQTKTVIDSMAFNLPVTYFAKHDRSIIMYSPEVVYLYDYSDMNGYTLTTVYHFPEHSSDFRQLLLTDTHFIIRSHRSSIHHFRHFRRDTGAMVRYEWPAPSTYQVGHLDRFEWMLYDGQQAIFWDFETSDQYRIFYQPVSSGFTAQALHWVRLDKDVPEIYLMRTTSTPSLPNKLVKLVKQHHWILE